ncbi:hypothetical protein H0H87_007257 [Tephrocybe sp. NHM501043]|nr:hypothetical protein H0H87_007257 [Tephrocybe sp. NHM501043]
MDAEAAAVALAGADDAAAKIDDRIGEGLVESNVIDQSSSHEMAAPVLHSPTADIVGTPFTTDSRFEYPFPNTDPSSTSSFPSISAPTATHNTHSLSGMSSAPASITSFSPIFSLPTNFPTYSHPKMRATPPPVPPSLVKKRQRWTLALPILRRRSSQPNEGTTALVVEGKETRSVSIDIMRPQDTQPSVQKH